MSIPRPRVSCLIAIFVSVVWGGISQAAGLGPVAVQSALGQPLHLSIPLVGAADIDAGSHYISAKVASPSSSLDATDATQAAHRAHPNTPSKTAASSIHPILRLSPPAQPAEFQTVALTLRISDHLTALPDMPLSAATAQPGTEQQAESPTAATSARDRQLEEEAQRLLRDLQAEAASLRIETARIKRQNASYQGTMIATHHDSLNWIKTLSVLLAACLAALGWLLWRIMAMKRGPAHPWHELFTSQGVDTIDAALLDSNTEFGTTGFNLPEIHTEEFRTTIASTVAGPAAAPAASAVLPERPSAAPRQPATAHAAEPATAPPPAACEHDNGPSPLIRTQTDASTTGYAPTIKAEEVSEVKELVEAWRALNAPEKVLELLQSFSETEQPASPLPWLCLLDVYRELGDQQKYEAILERIQTIFNVKLAPWTPLPYVEHPKALADFPHVVAEIVSRWQGNELVPYLKSLLVDDREGTRHGFDLSAYRDIMQLTATAGKARRLRHDGVMPEKARRILFRTPAEQGVPQQSLLQHISAIAKPSTDAAPPVRMRERRPAPDTNDMTPMAIKLHLAIAYQDIGDKEGASLLLDEVIHEGTSEQSEQARRMRARLA